MLFSIFVCVTIVFSVSKTTFRMRGQIAVLNLSTRVHQRSVHGITYSQTEGTKHESVCRKKAYLCSALKMLGGLPRTKAWGIERSLEDDTWRGSFAALARFRKI